MNYMTKNKYLWCDFSQKDSMSKLIIVISNLINKNEIVTYLSIYNEPKKIGN